MPDIFVPPDLLPAINALCKRGSITRAELIRRAIAFYLRHRAMQKDVFGMWKDRRIEGVEYQGDLRREWGQ